MVSFLTLRPQNQLMKNRLVLFTFSFLFIHAVNSQGLKNIFNKMKDSSSVANLGKIIDAVSSSNKDTLSGNTISNGLKEALQVGTEKGSARLSAVDGFFKNAALKILMPAEAEKVETKLRALGLGKQVDNAILSMNRAAEDASKSAAPIFISAIKR